jgi:hypothetical protein
MASNWPGVSARDSCRERLSVGGGRCVTIAQRVPPGSTTRPAPVFLGRTPAGGGARKAIRYRPSSERCWYGSLMDIHRSVPALPGGG